MPKYFNAEIRNGRLVLDKQNFRNSVNVMPEGHYLLLLFRIDNNRTEREWQKLYRVLLKEMSMDIGHSPTEMHEFAKNDVLSEMNLSSTTELDTASWREYIERLGDWALDKFDFVI